MKMHLTIREENLRPMRSIEFHYQVLDQIFLGYYNEL